MHIYIYIFFGTSDVHGKYFQIFETVAFFSSAGRDGLEYAPTRILCHVSEFIVSDKELSHWNHSFREVQHNITKIVQWK